MKIRITGAKLDTYWYADRIGQIFEVKSVYDKDNFLVDTGDFVGVEDCELVKKHKDEYTVTLRVSKADQSVKLINYKFK